MKARAILKNKEKQNSKMIILFCSLLIIYGMLLGYLTKTILSFSK